MLTWVPQPRAFGCRPLWFELFIINSIQGFSLCDNLQILISQHAIKGVYIHINQVCDITKICTPSHYCYIYRLELCEVGKDYYDIFSLSQLVR